MAVDTKLLEPGVLVLVQHPHTGKPFTAKVETVYGDMIALLPDWWGFKYPQLFWLANVVAVLDAPEPDGSCLRLRPDGITYTPVRRTA